MRKMGEDLDKSQDMFLSDDEGDIQFTVNMDLFNIQSDTEPSPVQREENMQYEQDMATEHKHCKAVRVKLQLHHRKPSHHNLRPVL